MLTRIFNPKENCVEVTTLLIRNLNANVTPTTIEKKLTSHPNYPSAVSISDLLNSLNIDNLSFSATEDFLKLIPNPFLTLVKSDHYHTDMYTIVEPLSKGQIRYFDPDQHRWKTLDHKNFLVKWKQDFVMLFDAEEPVIEENYKKNMILERRNNFYRFLTYALLPFLSLTIIILNLIIFGAEAVDSSIFITLSLAGCFVTSLLLSYDVDKHNPILKNICGKGGKVNCEAILSSKSAKIAGISWSAIGFTYFAGQLILGLSSILTKQPVLLTTIYITNALALPYIIYSISFQWLAKKWCTLCLLTQLLLALQFLVTIESGFHFIHNLRDLLQIHIVGLVVFSFSLPAILLSMLMPNLLATKEGRYAKSELTRLKHNPEVFNTLLRQQQQVTINPSNIGIKLGSGENKIIKVCNPFCKPCSDAHKIIEEIIRDHANVEVQIIYWISPTEKSSNIVKHFMGIEEKYGKEKLKEALDYWYFSDTKDYASFASQFPLNSSLLEKEKAVGLMFNWCSEEKVSFTPTFYLNGFRIPSTYSVDDLKYILAD